MIIRVRYDEWEGISVRRDQISLIRFLSPDVSALRLMVVFVDVVGFTVE